MFLNHVNSIKLNGFWLVVTKRAFWSILNWRIWFLWMNNKLGGVSTTQPIRRDTYFNLVQWNTIAYYAAYVGQKVPFRFKNEANVRALKHIYQGLNNRILQSEGHGPWLTGYLYAGLLPTWLAKWLTGFYGPYDEWSIGGIDVWAICAAHRELKLGMKSIIAWLDAIKNSISTLLFKYPT